jgi:hypothetical protein
MNEPRHAKPTAAQLLARIYRQQLVMRQDLEAIHTVLATHARTLADHCARLSGALRPRSNQFSAVVGCEVL